MTKPVANRTTEAEEGLLLGFIRNPQGDKGFAFLVVQGDDRTFFLHHSELSGCELKQLLPGEWVRFRPVNTAKGWRATEAEKVEPGNMR